MSRRRYNRPRGKRRHSPAWLRPYLAHLEANPPTVPVADDPNAWPHLEIHHDDGCAFFRTGDAFNCDCDPDIRSGAAADARGQERGIDLDSQVTMYKNGKAFITTPRAIAELGPEALERLASALFDRDSDA